jgi:hypothetical protein
MPATYVNSETGEITDVATLAHWLADQTWSSFAQDLAAAFFVRGNLTPRQVEAALRMRIKCEARAAERPAPAERVSEPGFYRDGDAVYRVQQNRARTNLYAKRLTASGGWEYAAGAMRTLTPAMRLTVEQAAVYGRETGRCVCCGETLGAGTDPVQAELSLAVGIGPACVRRHFGMTQRQYLARMT